MTQKQQDKHIADNAAEQQQLLEGTEKPTAEPTPDGLGNWEGGLAALKGSNRWVAEKEHTSRTGDTKNKPGIDYPSKITQRQQKDFTEVHMSEDGKVLLYNAKTDTWDIEGTTDDLPFYRDAEGKLWAFNWRNGLWDVETVESEFESAYSEEAVQQRLDDGDTIAQAVAAEGEDAALDVAPEVLSDIAAG
jgi:hypothetical protein